MAGFDVLTTRVAIIWVALAVAAAVLKGMLTPLMRAGAKGSDPSIGAAYFAICLSIGCAAVAYLEGTLPALWALDNATLLRYALCGAISALLWLNVFTALTGGLASKVAPILNLSTVIVLAASHFLFGARIGLWRLCCMLLILLGTVLLLSRTKTLRGQYWFIYALLAMVFYSALSITKTLLLPDVQDDMPYHIVRASTAAVLLLLFALVRGKQRTLSSMPAASWVCIPLAAFVYAGSFACYYLSARYGDMSMLLPVTIVSFASMLLFSRIIVRERQPISAVFGGVLVMLGMFAILMGF